MNLKSVLLTSVCFCATMATAQNSAFTLTVKDILAKPTDKAFLCYAANGAFHADSAAMTNGTFVLQGEAPSIPQRAVLYIYPGGHNFYMTPNKGNGTTVYIEKGDIQVYLGNTLGEVKIGGTRLNDDYQTYYSMMTPFKEREAEMEQEFQQAKSAGDEATMKRLQTEYQELNAQKKASEEVFFNDHLDSEISLDWLAHTMDIANEKSKAQALFYKMSERVRNTPAGKRYEMKLGSVPSVEVGCIAPDFTSKDLYGDEVSLSSFRGKYVLVDFWASWCGPCRRENPNVVKAYKNFKSDKFEILGYSLDNDKLAWENAVKKDELVWTQVSDLAGWQGLAVGLYAIRAVPANFLIDPEGKIIARDLRGEELEKKLSEIFNRTGNETE